MTIKNGDMPAMPVIDDAGMPFNSVPDEQSTIGLTKREMMAMHMMASICVRYGLYLQEEGNAALAVKQADALLAELERTK